ncbi:MAG: sulfatase-like hydrolase/transferase [Opitutae bacterium]|nr:sulfatase-like hydrolase/transferase [Opitutae bacterium]
MSKNLFTTITYFLIVSGAITSAAKNPPNILFDFADDWGRYASIYADSENPSLNDVIETPNIDRIGREGLVFKNAFVPVASCNPCRSSLATGRYFWNCGSGAFLNPSGSSWTNENNPFSRLPKFVDGLADSGYHTARSGKTFAFTPTKTSGNQRALPIYKDKFPRYGLYVGEATDEAERQERHFHSARAGNLPYPMRAVRNKDYLYIKNFKPERWPMGDPHSWNTDQKPTYDALHTQTTVTTTDLDASLTKAYMFTHPDDHFELTLGKRPMEELYDIKNDPDQLHNLATNSGMAPVLKKLRQQVDAVMLATNDPRLTDSFDYLPYSDPTKPRVRVR